MEIVWKTTAGTLFGILLVGLIGGCSLSSKPFVKIGTRSFEAGSIISGATGQTLSFEDMLTDLRSVRVVYVGETHNDAAHHDIQLKIIQALYRDNLIWW